MITPSSLASVPRAEVAEGCMLVLHQLQNSRPEAQTAALALVFIRLCKRHGIRPSTVMQIADNVFTDGERVHPAFRAVDAYIQGENL